MPHLAESNYWEFMRRFLPLPLPLCWLMLLAVLTALSGCATDANLKELRKVTPRGTPYAIALTQHYLEFAEAEAKAYDWTDSSYFAEKGLASGYGQTVTPEELASWDIAPEIKPEIAAAREKLMLLLTDETRAQLPKESAEATFAFDCWLEELEEGWSQSAISACQDRLYEAMESLEFAKNDAPFEAMDNTAYLVYFGYNSANFTQAAAQVVAQILGDIVNKAPPHITIHGHTDSSGSESYNMRLSELRAVAVLEALIAGGIPESLLSYFAFGETDPAVPTGDNVREPKNRRVEIFFG